MGMFSPMFAIPGCTTMPNHSSLTAKSAETAGTYSMERFLRCVEIVNLV